MDSVKEYLDTDLGIKKIHPAMTTDYPTKEENLTCYNKGCGENGSVFCHANTWAIIAECMLKRPENAWKYYHQLLPMIAQKTAGAERYKAEPYVYSYTASDGSAHDIVIGGSLEDYGYMEYVYDAGGSFVGSAGILPTGYDSANSPPWLTAYEEARGLSF